MGIINLIKNYHMRSFIAALCVAAVLAADPKKDDAKKDAKPAEKKQITDKKAIEACKAAQTKEGKACDDKNKEALKTAKKAAEKEAAAAELKKCKAAVVVKFITCMTAGSVSLIAGAAFVATAAALF